MTIDRDSGEFRDYLDLYEHAPLLELAALADAERYRHHPDDVVTYIIDRNINYTNVCVADCGFCAFYRRPRNDQGYVLSYEEIGAKIDECKAIGGVQILLQGGHNPYIPFEWYLELMRYIKRHHPIHIHGFSPSEVVFFAERFGLTGGRGRPPAARRRARFHPRRRRRDPRRRGPPAGRAEEGADRRLARRAGRGAPPGDEDVGDHDVRARREPRRPDRASVPGARAAGAHRRVHGVHLLAAAAGRNAGDERPGQDRRRDATCARWRWRGSSAPTSRTCSRAG